MLFRVLMLMAFFGGLYYLYHARHAPPAVAPEAPPVLQTPPPPVVSGPEIEKVRNATHDADPAVRWAAVELLYRMHDPQAVELLENMLAMDTEPSLRQNSLNLIKKAPPARAIKDLLRALRDPETNIRASALMALGEIGDSSVAPQVAELINDTDSSVRLQALHTLGQFQERKRVVYDALTEKLRLEYEQAVRKSRRTPSEQEQ